MNHIALCDISRILSDETALIEVSERKTYVPLSYMRDG